MVSLSDLAKKTYQKILAEAVKELKEDEFADLYAEELQAAEKRKISDENFVDEMSGGKRFGIAFLLNEYISQQQRTYVALS